MLAEAGAGEGGSHDGVRPDSALGARPGAAAGRATAERIPISPALQANTVNSSRCVSFFRSLTNVE